jgi:hypothetical protein
MRASLWAERGHLQHRCLEVVRTAGDPAVGVGEVVVVGDQNAIAAEQDERLEGLDRERERIAEAEGAVAIR